MQNKSPRISISFVSSVRETGGTQSSLSFLAVATLHVPTFVHSNWPLINPKTSSHSGAVEGTISVQIQDWETLVPGTWSSQSQWPQRISDFDKPFLGHRETHCLKEICYNPSYVPLEEIKACLISNLFFHGNTRGPDFIDSSVKALPISQYSAPSGLDGCRM